MRTTHRTTRLALTVTGLAATLTLAACGGGHNGSSGSSDSGGMSGMSGMSSSASGSTSGVSKAHNDADVMFTQQMTAHHQEAVQMADLAATRASNAQVKDLATQIKNAQKPEITTMTGWLSAWGESTDMSGMSHDMSDMPGGMSTADMNRLAALSGSEFDRQFLTMMITHHQGAVDMAKTEQADGSNPDAKALAAKIIADQTAQISQMQTLLTQV